MLATLRHGKCSCLISTMFCLCSCLQIVLTAAGTDSNASGSEQLAVAASTTLPTSSPTGAAPSSPQEPAEKPSGAVPDSLQETGVKPKQATPQKGSKSPKAPVSPRSGLKRKAVELC